MSEQLEHGMNCAGRCANSDEQCTCGLRWRVMLQTEMTMHAAWRKRAEEAERSITAACEGTGCVNAHELAEALRQARADRDVLAREVNAWRAGTLCGNWTGTLPVGSMVATNEAGALSRVNGGGE